MDYILGLPMTTTGKNAILVVVDSVSKRAHFIPCTAKKGKTSAEQTATLFFEYVFKYHGLPQRILSDRDTRFTSKFWKTLMSSLGTSLAMSTAAFHPQTDGQTERLNKTLEEMLRH